MRAAIGLVALAALLPFAHALPLGVYAGQGESGQYGKDGECHVSGPTTTELRAQPDGTWAFDASLTHTPPIGCGGFYVGTTTWPSFWSDSLVGTPESGFTDHGDDWDLAVSPLGHGTTWSIHVHELEPGYVRHTWWNGTVDLVGAHA